MSILIALAYLAIGAIAGLSAGLFGVGGGIIFVPALVWLLPLNDIPDEIIMHTAIATSLLIMIPTAASSSLKHYQQGNIQTPLLTRLGLGIFIGSIVGVFLAKTLSRDILQPIFGLFILLIAYQLIAQKNTTVSKNGILRATELPIVGAAIGSLSSLLGVGGGTMTVPYLNWRGINMRAAIGNSAACGLIIAITGAATFATTSAEEQHIPYLVGYIYLPVAALIALTSIISARFGAALSMRLPVPLLKKLFGLLLIIVAIRMLLQN